VTAFRIAAILCLIGGAVQSGANNLPVFLVFRLINGLGVGMCLTATPLYQSELSPPASRGVLVGCHGAFLAIGYNIASWTGLGCFFAKSSSFKWRFPLALQVLFPLILFISSFWLPESPRWLVSKDRLPEAKKVLESLHGSKHDIQQTFAHAEFEQIVAQIKLERRQKQDRLQASNSSFLQKASMGQGFVSECVSLFAYAPHRWRAFLGFTIMFGAQCTGVLVINNYQVILFPSLGVSPALSLGLYSVYLAIALVGNSTCGFIVDRVGRRPCLLIGLCGCLVALIGETITARYAADTGASKGVLSAAVFFIFLYIPFFSTLIDPNMYIYASEIFPAEVRSVGVAVSMSGTYSSQARNLPNTIY
jgi:MFS family permease